MLDTATIRAQFPILETQVHGKPLIYLDNAATTQKPLVVLDASRRYYETQNANVHRGSHYLSQLATEAHEQARETAAGFINAPETAELLFTSGCTM
ncbi:aminotransferase class V-fold PLP-dependent enzyme, partial [Bacteroides caccae]|uniref:aminotransferase class V-fold PLP-dependent enzyme n=2 Tax=Pseudomonadati TaxID=3379134 RepID=UPI0012317E28